jgi:hypothetical protein
MKFYVFRGTRLIKCTICHGTPLRSLKAAAGGATTSQRSEDWWRRALSWYRNLSLGQEQSEKTMTSLLIIPSVLAQVLFINDLAGFVWRVDLFFISGTGRKLSYEHRFDLLFS